MSVPAELPEPELPEPDSTGHDPAAPESTGPDLTKPGPTDAEQANAESVDAEPAKPDLTKPSPAQYETSAPGGAPAPDHRLRAADADRELVHQILSAAMTSGALTPSEYEERALKASTAKTFGDLDELTDDLPVGKLGVPLPRPGDPYPTGVTRPGTGSGRKPVRHRLAIMSGSELKGHAAVADQLEATAIMGGVEIDLREVEFTEPVLTVQCVAIMGGVDVIVPPDVTLEVGGLAIMGGFEGKAEGPGRPGAPTVHVTGFALMGGVDVKRKERR